MENGLFSNSPMLAVDIVLGPAMEAGDEVDSGYILQDSRRAG